MAGPTNLSGTYDFSPSLGELVLYAYNLCQIRPPALTQQHMVDVRMAFNLMLANWANKGVNLWEVKLATIPLVQGTETYSVPNNVVTVLDVYARTQQGSNPPVDRPLLPISRSEYSTYSNKTQQGVTTVFWFDRLLAPTLTFWLVPDGTTFQQVQYYYVTQMQDANLPNGQQPDIPYRWLEAAADGLAHRLSRLWKPELSQGLKVDAAESYQIAADQDVEQANQYISPDTSSYWRV